MLSLSWNPSIRLPLAVAVVFAGHAVSAMPPAWAAKNAASKQLAASASVRCTVRSMLGTQKAGSVDKRLSFLSKQLAQPPFSAFKSFKLLAAKELKIGQGATEELVLPSQKLLRLSFTEKLLDGNNKVRLRLHLSITPPKRKKFLPGTQFSIADGGTLLVGGDKHADGTLVVGVTCKSQ